jgi:phosphoribosylformylglycinamidine (FGAM) synthase-like enzyme
VLLAPAACCSGLEKVPLQDASFGPPEILMSKSQERMMAGRRARQVDEFLAVCARYVRTRPELGLSTIRDNVRELAPVMSAVPGFYQR